MAEIQMIKTANLNPHPDNPRKDVGDVSELASSLKANGVLQNLTVVPYYSKLKGRRIEGQYTVIIGHRRLAAAEEAGIDELPCTVVEMTEEEQLATMLTENMQRSDLTVYEQAKTFQQLSFDFGMSDCQIADMSGFSEATVKRRTKLADLDEKKFKSACSRGATLADFAELDKVNSDEDKNALLDKIGTKNFRNELHSVLDKQRYLLRREKWIEQLSAFAFRIEQQGYFGEDKTPIKMNYVKCYGSWTKDEDISVPEDISDTRYFYTVSDLQISVYREEIITDEQEEAKRKQEALRAELKSKSEQLDVIARRHYTLRKDFVKNCGCAKSNIQWIMRAVSDWMFHHGSERAYYGGGSMDFNEFAELMGYTCSATKEIFNEYRNKYPEKTMLLLYFWWADSEANNYIKSEWNREKGVYVSYYKDNQKLDDLYYLLETLGYELSDEERQMKNGTHPLFYKDEE